MDAWRAIATGCNDEAWLIDCIQFGFPMQYRGPPLHNTVVSNHPSAVNHDSHVSKYIRSEISMGALIGPFDHPPFKDWCNVAPLMTREKANKTDRRIIVDLSYPAGNGPNHFIVKNEVFGSAVAHVLPSVNDAINIITSLEFDVMLASVDISRAYRNFALDPFDWPLACIHHHGKYYIDRCMPFGSRISSLYMQKMACLIQRALINKGINTVVYLDDLLVISHRNKDPQGQFNQVIDLIKGLGLPIAWDKVTPPARCVRFLGIIIDVDQREIRMPREKIENFLDLIHHVGNRRSITKRTLQQILGHINHLSKAVPPARLFINRLLECLRGTGDHIWMDERLRSDLRWFTEFLTRYNGRSLILDPTPTVTIEADSCLSGGGGRMCKECYAIQYPPSVVESLHISQLEAYNCLIAARVFLTNKSDMCVRLLCDNQGAVSCLASGRARDPVLGKISRAFWFFSAKRNIKFKFKHMPGESMGVADALSRAHLSAADAARARQIVGTLGLRYVEVGDHHCVYDYF